MPRPNSIFRNPMKKKNNKSPFPWNSVSVILFTAAVLTTIIIAYSEGQKKRLLSDAVTEMEAIANVKSIQVSDWKKSTSMTQH